MSCMANPSSMPSINGLAEQAPSIGRTGAVGRHKSPCFAARHATYGKFVIYGCFVIYDWTSPVGSDLNAPNIARNAKRRALGSSVIYVESVTYGEYQRLSRTQSLRIRHLWANPPASVECKMQIRLRLLRCHVCAARSSMRAASSMTCLPARRRPRARATSAAPTCGSEPGTHTPGSGYGFRAPARGSCGPSLRPRNNAPSLWQPASSAMTSMRTTSSMRAASSMTRPDASTPPPASQLSRA
jgi:hypothetical protein